MLKYSLSDNTLTARPDDCSTQTHCVTSLDKEAIIAGILKRGTTLTKTDILDVLNSFEEVITSLECILKRFTIKLVHMEITNSDYL